MKSENELQVFLPKCIDSGHNVMGDSAVNVYVLTDGGEHWHTVIAVFSEEHRETALRLAEALGVEVTVRDLNPAVTYPQEHYYEIIVYEDGLRKSIVTLPLSYAIDHDTLSSKALSWKIEPSYYAGCESTITVWCHAKDKRQATRTAQEVRERTLQAGFWKYAKRKKYQSLSNADVRYESALSKLS